MSSQSPSSANSAHAHGDFRRRPLRRRYRVRTGLHARYRAGGRHARHGTDPSRKLVTPRVLAAVLMQPLLTGLADFVGLLGGCAASVFSLRLSAVQFWTRAIHALEFGDLMQGMMKPLVFGFILATVGCYKGLTVRGGTKASAVLPRKPLSSLPCSLSSRTPSLPNSLSSSRTKFSDDCRDFHRAAARTCH